MIGHYNCKQLYWLQDNFQIELQQISQIRKICGHFLVLFKPKKPMITKNGRFES